MTQIEDLALAPWRIARQAARLSLRQLRWTERAALGLLSSRLQTLELPAGDPVSDGGPGPVTQEQAGTTIEELLGRSLAQSARRGQGEFYAKLVQSLVPDEARILAALSDASSATLMHIDSRTVGSEPRRELANASTIGHLAGVTVPHLTPGYVTHLLALGLVEIGPEDRNLKLDYEALAASRPVREALKAAASGPVPARVVRRTLRLAPLGHELWAWCQADRHDG